MQAKLIVEVVGMFGLMACAATGGAVGALDAHGVAMPQAQGVRAGEAKVVAIHINPRVPVHVTAENGALVVRFAHPGMVGARVHLNAQTLMPVSEEERVEGESPAAPATGAVRVVLSAGRFVECWRRGSMGSGYQLMAQAWTADGSPLGHAVVVSPADSDVLGAPKLVTIDGEHAVATFAATLGDRFELFAVPLDVL
ncbi:MAG TPA: hypothetical protein VGY54_26690 [Polyangiaceae bacterium]|jgi:hypothetical protein|nr:hypothetical protein [Polyangiaceae bacterium]